LTLFPFATIRPLDLRAASVARIFGLFQPLSEAAADQFDRHLF
jgi:hypothetical protein